MTLEKVKELLGVTELPGTPEELEKLVEWIQDLVEKYGEDWIRENKDRLFWEWEF